MPKGESMGIKLVELFANRVVERRNMIMSIFSGELALRVSMGVFEFCEFFVLLSFSQLFFAILAWYAAFRVLC
jgi:hypothetical protein